MVRVVRLGIDGHVLDGKPQGSRSVLLNFLRALTEMSQSEILVTVYCDHPERYVNDPTISGATFVKIRAEGRTKRLLYGGLGGPGYNDVELYSYALPLITRARSLLIVHDVLPFTHTYLFPVRFRIPFQLLVRRSLTRADRILTVSRTGREALVALLPQISSRVGVALNGPSFPEAVYLEACLADKPASVRPYILCVGRIEKRKNVQLLIDAYLAANLQTVDLMIVGRLDDGFQLSIPIDPRIKHNSFVDDEQLIKAYRSAALFVYPSSAEGFGIPLLDGLAFGVPTISSDQTSMPEIGGNLPCYFNPDAHDSRDVLAALMKGHFDDRPLTPPSLEMRRELLSRFNWRRFAMNILDTAKSSAESVK